MNSYAENKSVINLFKVVSEDNLNEMATVDIENCLRKGYVVMARDHVIERISANLYKVLNDTVGINTPLFNSTFHKSFSTVENMDPETYYFQQMLHYLSTYGLESYGLEANPYIPIEKFNLPEGLVSTKAITVISVVSNEEIQYLINSLMLKTRSPSNRIKDNIAPLLSYVSVSLDSIKSFELMIMVAKSNNIVPESPISFLRYLVYETTGSTLLIKSKESIEGIKNVLKWGHDPTPLFAQADLKELSSIFFRYKPIFLAYKTCPTCRPYINKLRRLANKYHKPLSEDSIQNVSKFIIHGETDRAVKLIHSASNRELVKLYNFINNHIGSPLTQAYKVRNGKVYVDKNIDNKLTVYDVIYMRDTVRKELITRLTPLFKGINFVIPEYIDYAVPTSEKQFLGNIPWGTQITLNTKDNAFTAGIAWNNGPNGERVDLDLHLNSTTKHFGWNSSYASDKVIYTGDMTDATNGAAEAYWFKSDGEPYILSANKFSGPSEVEYKLFMTEVPPQTKNLKYTFDPATALFNPISLVFNSDSKGQALGLFLNDAFFFYGGTLTTNRVPSKQYPDFVTAIANEMASKLGLKELLRMCGGNVVAKPAEGLINTIDLSPSNLTSTSLLDLVDGNLP